MAATAPGLDFSGGEHTSLIGPAVWELRSLFLSSRLACQLPPCGSLWEHWCLPVPGRLPYGWPHRLLCPSFPLGGTH